MEHGGARREPGRPRGRALGARGLELAASYGLYACFAGTLRAPEAAIGGVVAVIATVGSRAARRQHTARFEPRFGWLLEACRLPWGVVKGTWAVVAVLFRHLVTTRKAGSMVTEVPFAVGGDDEANATRRALAAAYTTITPDVLVLGVDRARGLVAFHQLERGRTPTVLLRLGAER